MRLCVSGVSSGVGNKKLTYSTLDKHVYFDIDKRNLTKVHRILEFRDTLNCIKIMPRSILLTFVSCGSSITDLL